MQTCDIAPYNKLDKKLSTTVGTVNWGIEWKYFEPSYA